MEPGVKTLSTYLDHLKLLPKTFVLSQMQCKGHHGGRISFKLATTVEFIQLDL